MVGASLWAAKRIKETNSHVVYAFPIYNNTSTTNANSASAAINKWLKPRVPEGCVVHSFRHSMRDRLREVQCPADMIDQIGGWSTAGIGKPMGGYSVSRLHDFMLNLPMKLIAVFLSWFGSAGYKPLTILIDENGPNPMVVGKAFGFMLL